MAGITSRIRPILAIYQQLSTAYNLFVDILMIILLGISRTKVLRLIKPNVEIST